MEKLKKIEQEVDRWQTYAVADDLAHELITSIFTNFKADKYNWFFLSTDGVHGTDKTLDELDKELTGVHVGDCGTLTFLIVQPRIVRTYAGTVTLFKKDIPNFRKLVKSTLKIVVESQKENI